VTARTSVQYNIINYLWSCVGSKGLVYTEQHDQFMLVAVTFKIKHSGPPAYLHDDLHEYQPTRMLQSATAHQLQWPLILTYVAFTVTASTVWNSLSVNSQSADSFASFKRRLKSELIVSTHATQDSSVPLQHSDSCMRLTVLYKSSSSSSCSGTTSCYYYKPCGSFASNLWTKRRQIL